MMYNFVCQCTVVSVYYLGGTHADHPHCFFLIVYILHFKTDRVVASYILNIFNFVIITINKLSRAKKFY